MDNKFIIETIIRAIIIYFLLLIVTRFIGRKGISKITFFDFVVVIMFGSLGANVAMGPLKNSYTAAIVIITLSIIIVVTGYLATKSFVFRKIFNSEPIVLVENGKINEQNMKKSRITINDLTTLLREKKIFNMADVEFALLENDGKISVLPKSQKQPITPSDMNISTPYKGLNKDIVLDGNIMYENLKDANYDENWLMEQLKNYNINDIKEVLYASVDSSGNLYVSKKRASTEKHGKYGIE